MKTRITNEFGDTPHEPQPDTIWSQFRSYFGVSISLVLGIVIAVSIILGGWFTVDAGHVGVIKRFGAIQNHAYGPGLHFKLPWLDGVTHVNIQIQNVDATAGAASKDMQVVTTQVSVPYYLEPEMVPALINALGTRAQLEKAVLEPAIQESVKASTAQYTAEQLIKERSAAKAKIVEAVNNFIDITLASKSARGAAKTANVGIKDFDFSREFNVAIERRVQMEQQAQQAEIEKRKRITEAEAKNAEVKLAADAEAYQLEQVSTQRAAAIQREGDAMKANAGVAQLRAIEKWNGVLPVYNNGPLPLAIMDTGKLPVTPTAQQAAR